jgi:hypothetical protein
MSSRRHRHTFVPELIYTSVPMHLYGFQGNNLRFDEKRVGEPPLTAISNPSNR